MKFVRMHGLGNDYVYVDAFADPGLAARADLPDLARRMSDRHTGVGGDGIIIVAPPTIPEADVRMRMFNADGSESEMCGNGLRCVAKFAHDRLGFRGPAAGGPIRVQTGSRIRPITYQTRDGRVVGASVDMGPPILDLAAIPVDRRSIRRSIPNGHSAELGANADPWILESPVGRFEAWFVSMGNPHAVIRVPRGSLGAVELEYLGPELERHAAFPQRANINFVDPQSVREVTVRTWERGSGATRACGSGACAAVVAGAIAGWLDREAVVHVPGGDLLVRWDAGAGHVTLSGDAWEICEGEWPSDLPTPRAAQPRPTIATERLILRPMVVADVPDIARAAGRVEIARSTLLIPHPYKESDALSWITTHQRDWDRGEALTLAITLRGDAGTPSRLIGAVSIRGLAGPHRSGELGYWISPDFWGKGYATEAVGGVINHAFESLGLERVYADHFSFNPASGRVMAKCGMHMEGVARHRYRKNGEAVDAIVYSILRSEWRADGAPRGLA